jgi:ketosteroid isomerase-like protein
MESGADKIEDVLTDIQQRLARAWVDGDREFIESVLADDWSVIDLTGRMLTKEEVLREAFGSEERQVASMKIDDIRVRSFGDWAIVNGRTQAGGEYQGTMIEVTLRFTDVFVLLDGRWQAIASQATALNE